MTSERPIGVFDSGVGGISVLRDLRALLPAEDWLYVADSGFCPYGGRSVRFVQQRSRTITDFLLTYAIKALVIACNTATASAAPLLRTTYDLPIIGMEPAVKPAVAATRSGVVGVLATVGTVRSERLTRLIERFGRGVRILTQPCPGLVEQIEAGDLAGPITRELLLRYVTPLLEGGADVLVLGCTHYPFVRPLLQELVGPSVCLIDTGQAVARQTARRLAELDLAAPDGNGQVRFWTSGVPSVSEPIIRCLWGERAMVAALPTVPGAELPQLWSERSRAL